jgi:hypothetical protein
MNLEVRLKSFIVSAMWLALALALACGKVQEFIKFNSVDAEILAFVLSSGMGMACLVASLKLKR